VFTVGVAALLAVWFGRPLWADTPQRRFERDLAAARHLLAHPNGDAAEAQRLARRAVDASAELPERAGEALLLLGTAHLRLAEAAEPADAAAQWRSARQYLQEAEKAGVPEADQGRLHYRLAKVGLHTGGDLAQVIQQLEESVAQADNRAEGYRLLTEAYLRLPQPDLNKALEANRKLRDLAEATPAEQAAAKLQGGELLLRLGKPDEARKALMRVGKEAAPEVVSRARLLSARSYQDEGKWAEAARLYEDAVADAKAPLPGSARPRAFFDLGLCYRGMEQPAAAARNWAKCVEVGPNGPEAQAAALLLGEALLKWSGAPDPDKAAAKGLRMLAQAVAGVRQPGDWSNPLADLARAREAFQNAHEALRQAGRFEQALLLLTSYERVAPPGQVVLLRGELAGSWARLCLEKAKQAADAQARQAEEEQARGLFRQAAEAYAEAAGRADAAPEGRAKALALSAEHYLACGEHAQAIDKLGAYLKLEKAPAELGKGWYRLGEAHRAVHNAEAAEAAYRECLLHETRFAYLARYQLAEAKLVTGYLDEAEAALTLNLKLMRFDPDEEAEEKSLFALGGLCYRRRNYRDAARHLALALGRFKDNPEAVRARFQLADSYRQIASQENQNFLLREYKNKTEAREHYQKEHRRWLLLAAEEFTALAEFLDGPQGQGHLTPQHRAQVPLMAAKCWFNRGDYQKALAMYEGLIARYRGKVEVLDALGGAVRCHAALEQLDAVRQRLLQVQMALRDFEEPVRSPWEDWLRKATAGLSRAHNPRP
jgi:tetratricopeptide (TPR) repeat protein